MRVSPAQEMFRQPRVALALRRRGIERVHPLARGLMAWRELGLLVISNVRPEKTPVGLQQT
jgi:3-mercaptopyruvate sulfurtransferase SseA